MTCVRDQKPSDTNLCTECATTLHDAYTGLSAAYAQLDHTILVTGQTEAVSTGKVSGSPALIRLDVMALQDPRTQWDGNPDSPRHLPRAQQAWAHRLADWLGVPRTHEHAFITTWWSELLKTPWIGEFHDEVSGLARQLNNANGYRANNTQPTTVRAWAATMGCSEQAIRHRIHRGQLTRREDGTVTIATTNVE
jgi:hypothetical protein